MTRELTIGVVRGKCGTAFHPGHISNAREGKQQIPAVCTRRGEARPVLSGQAVWPAGRPSRPKLLDSGRISRVGDGSVVQIPGAETGHDLIVA